MRFPSTENQKASTGFIERVMMAYGIAPRSSTIGSAAKPIIDNTSNMLFPRIVCEHPLSQSDNLGKPRFHAVGTKNNYNNRITGSSM